MFFSVLTIVVHGMCVGIFSVIRYHLSIDQCASVWLELGGAGGDWLGNLFFAFNFFFFFMQSRDYSARVSFCYFFFLLRQSIAVACFAFFSI